MIILLFIVIIFSRAMFIFTGIIIKRSDKVQLDDVCITPCDLIKFNDLVERIAQGKLEI